MAEGAAGGDVNKEFTILASILDDQGCWAEIRHNDKRLDDNESAGNALLPEEARLLQADSQVGLELEPWSPIFTLTLLGLNTGSRHSKLRWPCWGPMRTRKNAGRWLV